MGITDLNKPHRIEVLNDNDYVNNIKEKYIEFDFYNVVKRWQDKELENNGLITGTEADKFYTFFTRESNRPPQLIVEYITTETYSTGRSDRQSTIFIYGKKHKDLSAKINVHSDIGFDWRKATIYVHRYEDPVDHDISAKIIVSKPSLKSNMMVKIRKESERDATIRITNQIVKLYESDLTINRPDLNSVIDVYGNSFMDATITIRRQDDSPLVSNLNVNHPDLVSKLEVSIYKKKDHYIDSTIAIRTLEKYDDIASEITTNIPNLPSYITVSMYKKKNEEKKAFFSVRTKEQYYDIKTNIVVNNPDIIGFIKVKGIKDAYISSTIDVMQNTNQDSFITINRPDTIGFITIKEFKDLTSTMYVRYRTDINATIDIKQISQISGTINIKRFIEILGKLSVNKPDLEGTLNVRVQGETDLDSMLMVKKRFVSDMSSIITVSGGSRNRNMIIMF
jgi:hypothetical protein